MHMLLQELWDYSLKSDEESWQADTGRYTPWIKKKAEESGW